MTRSKAFDPEQFREKTFANADEVAGGLEQLRALIKPVNELKREGNPYKDAERSKLEFQIKDALRDIFGEDSSEYQQNKNFRIKSTAKSEISHAVDFLDSLIAYLEDKKLELEGKKPKPVAPPPPPPVMEQPAVVPPPRPVKSPPTRILPSA